jgi:adenylosuccinate lyase
MFRPIKRCFNKPITEVSPLTAISPIDGRYSKACHSLRAYFSEYALMRYRVQVELTWFRRLFKENIVQTDEKTIQRVEAQHLWLDQVFAEFSIADGERVKEIEKVTNHDVKAIEYFLKEKFETNEDLIDLKEYLHFSCTSEDINNLAYALMLHNSMKEVMLP